jgi:16S rRNA processing protein RimM
MIAIGKIVGCFGIRGYVKVQSYTHSPERFRQCREVIVGDEHGNPVARGAVEDVISDPPLVKVRIAGIADRTSAERLRGCYLFVEDADVAPPPEGSYFIDDIIGCEVFDPEGKRIGAVEDVYKYPAQDVWAIRTPATLLMVPAVGEFLVQVDIARKRIVLRPPEGLEDGLA